VEWQFVLLIIFSILVVLMLSGMPIAFCFLLICVGGTYFYFGGIVGLEQLVVSMYTTCKSFILIPIPLFLFMGEVMFHSDIAPVLVKVVDKWLGRIPGRLSMLAVAAGTLFSTLTGTSLASVAMLGSALVPEMEKQGYQKPMSIGPILGSGGLAMMIPPSGLAVLLGAIAEVSVGRILIGIIIPGLLLAVVYAAYIVIRCSLQPHLAPAYEVEHISWSEKIGDLMKYVLPQGIVIFLVVGVIFIGVATPSEAAATGAAGTVFLAFCYKRMNWDVLKNSLKGTITVTGMIFLIIAGATAFSQILAFSGATSGLTEMVTQMPLPPILIIVMMMVIVLFLGGFMDVVAIMMITLPIFIPVIESMGYSPVWFCVLFLLNIEMAMTTPPFGMSLFIMKGVAPPDTSMRDIFVAAFPFLGLDLLLMILLLAFPILALWLPGLMS
jgi:tripartite ATP-independent transporter DctM subunit